MNESRSSREYLSFVCTHALQLSKHLCSPMHRRASRRNITRCRQGALVTVACARGFGEDHYLSTSKLKDKLICLCFRNFFILVHAPFSFSFSTLLSSSSLSCAFALLVPADLAHPVHLLSKQAADIYTSYLERRNGFIQLRSDDKMLREGQAVAELQQVCTLERLVVPMSVYLYAICAAYDVWAHLVMRNRAARTRSGLTTRGRVKTSCGACKRQTPTVDSSGRAAALQERTGENCTSRCVPARLLFPFPCPSISLPWQPRELLVARAANHAGRARGARQYQSSVVYWNRPQAQLAVGCVL
jgi:hypothetical protein